MLIAGRGADSPTLLLAGVSIGLASGAAISLALALAPSPFAFYDAFAWLMGGFQDRSLVQAAVALVPAVIAMVMLVRSAPALDWIALGDDSAAAMGVDPARLTRHVIAWSAIGVGAVTAIVGSIGFVGLIAPVVARRLVRGHPGRAVAPAALIGGVLMLLADLATRLMPDGRTLPVGVVTALVGVPLFVAVLRAQPRQLQ
jgi:iron complex transport system permease protein